ncbi:hypothetical protein JAAARDRAFT_407541 [Jaapia argillacea MUCL 33604]|uniref:Uncharacterized protein n=1 Tax=Jaapia argillacea MUCL 33604 TaxID=933084 RepID=A0A067PHL4_9AGAM|nr:hypothetical protein JAAARDRAFT_407541 [Jaapia argillacea MUCL 33604]
MQSVADADPSSQLFREWSEFESLYAALFLSTDSGVASELVSIAEFQGTAANATGPSGPRMTPAPSTYPPASVSTSPQDLANQRDNENPSTVFSNEAFIAYSFLPPDNSITRSNHQHAVTHYSPICSSSTAFPPPVIADGSSHRHCRNTFTPSLHQERNVNMDHDLTLASYPPSAYLAIPLHNRLEGGNRSARRPHLDVGRVRTSEGMAGMDAENLRLTGHFSEGALLLITIQRRFADRLELDNETSLDGRSKQPGYFADTHSLNTNSSQPSSQEDCSLPTRCSSPSHELPMGGALLSRRLSAPEAEQRRYGGGLFLSCQLDESFGISDVRRTLRPFRSLEYISAPSTLSNGIRHPFTNEFATVSPPEFSHQSNAEPSRSVEVNHGLKPPDSVWTAYRNGGLLAAPTSPAYSTDTPSDYSYGTDSSPMSGTPASVFAGDEFPAASTSHSPYEQSTQEGEGDRIFNNGQENREPRSDVEMTTMQAERRKGKRSRSPRAGSSVAFDVGTDAVGDAAIKRRKYPPKWKCEACQRTFTRKANWDCECAV